MIPSLQQVAISLVKLCKTNDAFTPTMLRQLLGRDFNETEPAHLSSQIQPHLRALRQAGVIALIHSNQKRNRPYRVIKRDLLIEISMSQNYYFPNPTPTTYMQEDEADEMDDQSAISKDETTNQIIDMERRLIALEELVETLTAKLNAVGTIFR